MSSKLGIADRRPAAIGCTRRLIDSCRERFLVIVPAIPLGAWIASEWPTIRPGTNLVLQEVLQPVEEDGTGGGI